MLVSLHVHFTSSLALAVPARVSYRHHNFHGFLFYTYRRSFFTLTYLAKLVQYLKAIPSIPFTLRVSYTLTDRPDELWIVEVEANQDRHEQRKSLESFLTILRLTDDDTVIRHVPTNGEPATTL